MTDSATFSATPGDSHGKPKLVAPYLHQLLAHTFPKRQPLLSPWLRAGESALIYAPPGVGKSLFTMSLALAVAGGGKLLGFEAPEPARVLFVDGEMYADDLQGRAGMLLKTVEGLDLGEAGHNFRLLARQQQELGADFPDLSHKEGQERLLELVSHGVEGEGGYGLVVLDNLSTLALDLRDENDATAFNETLGLFMRLKQIGVACLLVHHSNKVGSSYRGSSKLATTFEVILKLAQRPNLKDQDSAAFTLVWDKYRGLRNEATRPQEVSLVRDGPDVKWVHELSLDDDAERLLEALKTGQYNSQKEVASAIGFSEAKISRLRRKLVAGGHVAKDQWEGYLSDSTPDL